MELEELHMDMSFFFSLIMYQQEQLQEGFAPAGAAV